MSTAVEAAAARRARALLVAAVVACVAVVGAATAAVGALQSVQRPSRSGRRYANGVLLPTNQWISPLGNRILVDNAPARLAARSAPTATTSPR